MTDLLHVLQANWPVYLALSIVSLFLNLNMYQAGRLRGTKDQIKRCEAAQHDWLQQSEDRRNSR